MDAIRIVLADDNDEFRTELVDYLNKQSGLAVVAGADNGLEAVYLAHAHQPDVVLLDISMPGMSGLEAARQIKEYSSRIKIVFVTIHEEKTYHSLAHVIGVDGFVSKSNLKKDLLVLLQKFQPTQLH